MVESCNKATHNKPAPNQIDVGSSLKMQPSFESVVKTKICMKATVHVMPLLDNKLA